jgi:hypothetical protein
MRVWSVIGMVGAATCLGVIAVCLLLARDTHRRGMPWVSCLGSNHAPRHVRILFRVGVVVGAALFGAFAVASLVLVEGWRLRLGAGASVLVAGFLALLAICPMDGDGRQPSLHVIGALGYFTSAIAAAFFVAFPPDTAMDAAILSALAFGGVVIVPLFGIVARHTVGKPWAEIESFLTRETEDNLWVRVLQHPAVGITGVLLFLSAFAMFRALY